MLIGYIQSMGCALSLAQTATSPAYRKAPPMCKLSALVWTLCADAYEVKPDAWATFVADRHSRAVSAAHRRTLAGFSA